MDESIPMVTLRGKGRYGGKERRIPVNPMVYGEVLPFIRGKRPEDPVGPAPTPPSTTRGGGYSRAGRGFSEGSLRSTPGIRENQP